MGVHAPSQRHTCGPGTPLSPADPSPSSPFFSPSWCWQGSFFILLRFNFGSELCCAAKSPSAVNCSHTLCPLACWLYCTLTLQAPRDRLIRKYTGRRAGAEHREPVLRDRWRRLGASASKSRLAAPGAARSTRARAAQSHCFCRGAWRGCHFQGAADGFQTASPPHVSWPRRFTCRVLA